ncbi:GNAT family N-acetyltransferase [Salinactinospora qingdaonensis]
MSSSEMVRGVQERAARALPAEYVADMDGWWLRHAPRCSWWIGTVLPHGEVEQDALVRRVVAAEKFYAAHGAAARFQITPPACPEALDTVLAQRGYRRQGSLSLQTASTVHVLEQAPTGAPRVRLDGQPSRAWFEVWHAVQGHSGDARGEWDMLTRVQRPSAYARAVIGGDVVTVGRAVVDTGWAGVFGMASLPDARGKGAARSVLAALADWAAGHRANRMYLQVERDNSPALRLYERVGFSEVCRYHYRAVG